MKNFINFLHSIKDDSNKLLVESVSKAYITLIEARAGFFEINDEYVDKYGEVLDMGISYVHHKFGEEKAIKYIDNLEHNISLNKPIKIYTDSGEYIMENPKDIISNLYNIRSHLNIIREYLTGLN